MCLYLPSCKQSLDASLWRTIGLRLCLGSQHASFTYICRFDIQCTNAFSVSHHGCGALRVLLGLYWPLGTLESR